MYKHQVNDNNKKLGRVAKSVAFQPEPEHIAHLSFEDWEIQNAALQTPLKIRTDTHNTHIQQQKISPQSLTPCTPTLDQILKVLGPSHNQRHRTRSSSIVTNPYEEPVPNEASQLAIKPRGRPGRLSKISPTPSIKRGKAERLIKEHGSPPGIRVTAGGRIVPDSLTPINSPLDGTSSTALKQDHKASGFAPFPPTAAFNPMPLNGFVVNAGNGNLCQVVDGSLRAVEQHNGTLHLHMPAPNLPMYPEMMALPYGTPQDISTFLPRPMLSMNNVGDTFASNNSSRGRAQAFPSIRELRRLEQAHSQMEQELKDLDRNEVLQRASLTSAQRTDIVRHRVDLINRIDNSRKVLASVKRMVEEASKSGVHDARPYPHGAPTHMPTVLTHQAPLPLMNLQNFAAAAPLHGEHFDQTGFLAPQFPYLGNMFEPQAPEFVPKATSGYPPNPPQQGFTLQERAGNVGLGTSHRTSTETIKPVDTNRETGSMNFDGSAHQPRRSRAIEIKRPQESTIKTAQNLNPTSPIYRPLNAHNSNPEPLSAAPASVFSTAAENNQHQQQRGRDVSGSNFQDSDTSFTTADFFPTDSYKFSAKKSVTGQRDDQVNLSAWLPKAGESTAGQVHKTPTRPPNKFLFNDDSPENQYFATQSSENLASCDQNSLRRTSSTSNQFVAGGKPMASHLRESTATIDSVPRSNDVVLRNQPSTSKLLQIASERAATLTNMSPRKSDSYWEGYQVGFQQDLLSDIKDEDYCIGYRDGLLHSSMKFGRASFQSQLPSPTPDSSTVRRSEQSNRIPSMPKAVSFPGLAVVAGSPLPHAPANSLATTPTHTRSAHRDLSPGLSTMLHSPSRSEVQTQPYVGAESTRNRIIGTQTSQSLLKHDSPSLPLSDRPQARNVERSNVSELEPFLAKMKGRMEEFERQRYQKSSCSAVQTNTSARAYFKARYDGSADEDDPPLSHSEPNVPSPKTPRQKEKAKMESSGSPIKMKASVAVATMRQFAGIGPKKNEAHYDKNKKKPEEACSSQPSSPEKKKRSEERTKNFLQLKKHTE